jgi:tRNA threonylcarbamoyladenosine biosynthesis protein TsaE
MGRVGITETHQLASKEETIALGRKMASLLPANTVIALSGDLGAGKTTFVQGLGLGLHIQEPIQSPTFVLLNVYQDLYHFDLYRLKNSKEFLDLGFDEYFHKGGICVIEWPDRIADLLPPQTIHIHFQYKNQGRTATLTT